MNGTSGNTALGYAAALYNSTADAITAIGCEALCNNNTGRGNTALGSRALTSNSVGSGNTAVGEKSLEASGGSLNTAIGACTLTNLTTGINNIAIGHNSGTPSGGFGALTTESHTIVMGTLAHTNACISVPWTVVSDIRQKKVDGKVPLGLEFVAKLNPIKYRFHDPETKKIRDDRYRYGFSAQEIQEHEVDPQHPVIVNNSDPDFLGVSHEYLLPVLVNAIKELNLEVNNLKQQINQLTAAPTDN
jgi:hypothetical protein